MSRRRFLRAPSVDDYARMTQAVRIAAAEHVMDMLADIEERRLRYAAQVRPPKVHAEDVDPEETLRIARAMLPVVAQRWPETEMSQHWHRREAVADADTWHDAAEVAS